MEENNWNCDYKTKSGFKAVSVTYDQKEDP